MAQKSSFSEVSANRALAEKHPGSKAFAHAEDISISHEERMKLLDLENAISSVQQLIEARTSSYSSGDAHFNSVAASIDKTKIPSFEHLSESRSKILTATEKPDPLPPMLSYGELLSSEVLSLEIERNSYVFANAALREFFANRLSVLAMYKYILLKRWARFSSTSNNVEIMFPDLDHRLRNLERQYDVAASWLVDVEAKCGSLKGPISEPRGSADVLFDADAYRVYMRSQIHESRVNKKIRRFLRKLQWLRFAKKSEIVDQFQKSENIVQDGKLPRSSNALKIPMIAKFLEDLDVPLQELAESFDIRAQFTDEGQEYFYMISKKFNSIFGAQTSALSFSDYPHALFAKGGSRMNATSDPKHDGADGDSSGVPNSVPLNIDLQNGVFLKHADWAQYVRRDRFLDEQLERQRIVLEKSTKMDHVLRVECSFLESNDIHQVSKRLKDQVDVHLSRVAQSQGHALNVAQSIVDDDDQAAFSGPGRRAGSYVDIEERERLMMKHKLLSVYFLRFLRTREFRRKILDSLNYLRSVERRLTSDSFGYAFEQESYETSPTLNGSFYEKLPSVLSKDNTFGDPSRLSRVDDVAIMKMGTIEDRDDSYVSLNDVLDSMDRTVEDPFTSAVPDGKKSATSDKFSGLDESVSVDFRVRDSKGVYIMYDAAVHDLEAISAELIRLGSHCIANHDRSYEGSSGSQNSMQNASRVSANIAARLMQQQHGGGGFTSDLVAGKYGNGRPFSDVDRSSVLEDLFESEAWFQAAKKKVVDCLFEIYDHCTDPHERQKLNTMIMNTIYRRPRYDLELEYFSSAYASEIVLFELQASLLRSLITHQVAEERDGLNFVYKKIGSFLEEHPEFSDGYPLQPVSNTHPKAFLIPGGCYIGALDVYPSLSTVTQIMGTIARCVQELIDDLQVRQPSHFSALHRIFLQLSIVEWKLLLEEDRIAKSFAKKGDDPANTSYDRGILIEDPEAIEMIARDYVTEFRDAELKQSAVTRDLSTSQKDAGTPVPNNVLLSSGGFPIDTTESTMMQLFASSVELMWLRRALLDDLFECDVLFTVYRDQGKIVGRDVKNMQLDPLQFSSADKVEVTKNKGSEVLALRSDYLTNLAISEFESSLSHFDFVSSSGIKKLLSPAGLYELRRAVQTQVLQKNLYIVAVHHNQVLLDVVKPASLFASNVFVTELHDSSSPDQRSSYRSNSLAGNGESRPASAAAAQLSSAMLSIVSELFVSVNNLKHSYRAQVLRDYNERSAPIFKSKSPDAVQKRIRELKFELVHTFCKDMLQEIRLIGSRVQFSRIVESLRLLLEVEMQGKMGPFGFSATSGKGVRASAASASNNNNNNSSSSSNNNATTNTSTSNNNGSSNNANNSANGNGTASSGLATSGSSDAVTSGEFIRMDGTISSVFVIPSRVDVLRLLQTNDPLEYNKSKRALLLSKSMRIFSALLDVAYLVYMKSKLTVSLVEDVVQNAGLDQIAHDFSKLRDELEHVSDPTDPDVVLRYIMCKRRMLYCKLIVSLRNLTDIVSSKRAVVGDKANVADSLRILRSFENILVSPIDPWCSSCIVSDSVPDQSRSVARSKLLASLPFVVDVSGLPGSVWKIVEENSKSMRMNQNQFFHAKAVDHALHYGPFVGALVDSPLAKCKYISLVLGDAERNYISGEETAIDLLLDDLLAEEKVYSTSQSELAVSMQIHFLETSLTLAKLRSFYVQKVASARCLKLDDSDGLADAIKDDILVNVKPFIETFKASNDSLTDDKEKNRNAALSQVQAVPTLDALEEPQPVSPQVLVARIALNAPRKLTESLIRSVQILLLHQKTSALLIQEDVSRVQVIYARLFSEPDTGATLNSSVPSVVPSSFGASQPAPFLTAPGMGSSADVSSKALLVKDFLQRFLSRCVKRRGEPEEIVVCEVTEDHLNLCLDELTQKLMEWKSSAVDQRSVVLKETAHRLTYTIFQLESRLRYLESIHEMDRRALKRRVQIELADRNYELLYALDELSKENERLRKSMAEQEAVLRTKIEAEFQDRIESLDRELTLTKGKFDEYRTYLYREMQNNLMEVKKEAMLKMVESENAPLELKRKALKIARFDDEISRVKEENMEMKKTIMKMSLFALLRQATIKSRFERVVRKEVHEREKMQREYWANRERVEERETILRQQLVATQSALHSAEVELEQLRKDLNMQMKNKQQLVHWKVRNAQVLTDLEEKVKRYERWSHIDVDKLLIEIEKKDVALRQFASVEEKVQRKTNIIEDQKDREIKKLLKRLADEQRIKMQALSKLDVLRSEMDLDAPEQVQLYRDRYEASLQDLRRALIEIDDLRASMQESGMEPPSDTILADPHVVASVTQEPQPQPQPQVPSSGSLSGRSVSSSRAVRRPSASHMSSSQPLPTLGMSGRPASGSASASASTASGRPSSRGVPGLVSGRQHSGRR
eukprot:ANDGO_03363.mRNA.1 hypothetical protein AMSG_04194